MERVMMVTPLAEMDGDEPLRSLWRRIKEELIWPYVELEAEYYDLSAEKRKATGGRIVEEAAEAEHYYGVAVKCCGDSPEQLVLAWVEALRRRGEADGLDRLTDFAGQLEEACHNRWPPKPGKRTFSLLLAKIWQKRGNKR